MENLAGSPWFEQRIRRELDRAAIPYRPYEGKNKGKGEVPLTIEGYLGPLRFHRAWYYWVVDGPVPLALAEALYNDPVAPDIRVAGHCAAPSPDEWVHWYLMDSGLEVLPFKQLVEIEAHIASSPSLAEILDGYRERYRFSDDPASLGAEPLIKTYHIDSEVGLRVFVDAVRTSGLIGLDRPTWWYK